MSDDKPKDEIRIAGIVIVIAGTACLLVSLLEWFAEYANVVGGAPAGSYAANPIVVLIGVVCVVGGILIMGVARISKSGLRFLLRKWDGFAYIWNGRGQSWPMIG